MSDAPAQNLPAPLLGGPVVARREIDVAAAFRDHHPFVHRVLLCTGVPRAVLDDAVQDVFLTVHRRRRDYDARAPLRHWIYGIAKGVGRNHGRKARGHARRHAEMPALWQSPQQETSLARRQALALVDDFLRTLNPDQREVFMLAWARIEAEIEHGSEAPRRNWRRAQRRLRSLIGWARRSWRPIALVAIVAMTLGPVLRGDARGRAHLEIARSLITQGEHRRAYNVLVDHARLYKSKSAADERMELALQALCALNKDERAGDDLRRYLELNPESVHADRLPNVCGR